MKLQLLSPDGFIINPEKPFYRSRKALRADFDAWKARYEKQGYYSANYGRISLDELYHHCTIVGY